MSELRGWHYAARAFHTGGEIRYTLVEAYPAENGGYDGYTEAYFETRTPQELAKWLRQAADDVEKSIPLTPNEGDEI
jgi:hypothetical protein